MIARAVLAPANVSELAAVPTLAEGTTGLRLGDRYRAKRVWARDARHLRSRLLRKSLSHTLDVHLSVEADHPPLSLADLLVAR